MSLGISHQGTNTFTSTGGVPETSPYGDPTSFEPSFSYRAVVGGDWVGAAGARGLIEPRGGQVGSEQAFGALSEQNRKCRAGSTSCGKRSLVVGEGIARRVETSQAVPLPGGCC